MFVACSSMCFGSLSLADALKAVRDMKFTKVDLAIHDGGPHLTPGEVAADLAGTAKRLRAANLQFAAFHFAAAARDHLKAVCRLAAGLAVPVVTVAAAPAGTDLAAEAQRLADWSHTAEGEGVILCVETHAGTVTADPAGAAELCRRVPGLGVTLDPTHYLTGPHAAAGFDPVLPFVRHVRLRDSGKKPDQFQVRVGQGDIEYGRLVTALDRNKYDRALSVDVRDVPDNPFPVGPEVRKLKYLLESLV